MASPHAAILVVAAPDLTFLSRSQGGAARVGPQWRLSKFSRNFTDEKGRVGALAGYRRIAYSAAAVLDPLCQSSIA